VFISHRGADRVKAECLGEALRDRGHDVWLDAWVVGIGDSVIQKIDDGLAGSQFLILCCSDEASASAWMDREWMSALARQLEGEGIRVLPALLTGGALPSVLADVKFADLAADWFSGVDAICKAIGLP
jgi:hypothetical protein